MGTKFANLQVRDLSISDAETLITGSHAVQFSKGWTTIVHEDFEIGVIEQVARRISKKIDQAVMAVGYYDDEVLTLNIFKNGKSITCHNSNNSYGYIRKTGNPNTFVQELKLDEADRDYLKWIFKCEDLTKKVELLEKLFGIPLWISNEMLNELSAEYFIGKRDLSYIEIYIEEKKSSKKIINRTKSVLLMEFEGMYDTYTSSDCFLINHPSNEGVYYGDTERLYTTLPNGSLAPLLRDNSVQFDMQSKLLTNGNLIAVVEQSKWINGEWSDTDLLSICNRNGEVVTTILFSEEEGYPILLLPDASIICGSYGPGDQIITKYSCEGLKEWELEVGYLFVKPMFCNEHIYFLYKNDNTNKSEIVKVNTDGGIEARYEISPAGGNWSSFLFDQHGNMYYSCSFYQDGHRMETRLFGFDVRLQLIANIELSDSSFEGILDSNHNKIYIDIFKKEIIVVDIDSFQIVARKKHDDINLCTVDSHGGVIMLKGDSTIEVYDPELNLISRNRLKGDIYSLYKNADMNICVITGNRVAFDYGKAGKNIIRVYEIVYL